MFRCFYCGYTANAYFNASVNLHKVFWDTFPLPKKRKKLGRMGEKEEKEKEKKLLSFSPSNSPIPLKKPARKGKVAAVHEVTAERSEP